MAKTEDIEARLAAYVDGELDANQRAEIEKHLAEHPKHRQLIHELMAHKDLLKGLPKQAAPGDLAEAFTAQLERAVLLGDVDAEAARSPMRIGFFQQFRAVAAVLVLTAGLAAIIYQLLPRPQGAESALTDIRMAPLAPGPGVVLETDSRAESTVARSVVAAATESEMRSRTEFLTPTTQPTVSPAAIVVAMDVAGGRGPLSDLSTLLLDRADRDLNLSLTNGGFGTDSVFRQMVDEQMKLSAPAPRPSEMRAVLRAENINFANREVTQYLDNNNIKWEALSEPMPAPLGLREQQVATASLSRLQDQNVELKSGGAGVGGGGGVGGGRGGRGGGASAEAPLQPGQRPPGDRSMMNQSVAMAPGSNSLIGEAVVAPAAASPVTPQNLSQRIVAKQVTRQQAQQVVSDLNQLQSQFAMSKEKVSPDLRANAIDLARGYNIVPANAAPSQTPLERQRQDSFDATRLNESARAFDVIAPPATLPSPLRLVPIDPISFFLLHREPLSLTIPTTQTAWAARQPELPRPPADDLVDVVIVLEPDVLVETPVSRTQPATSPAP